MDNTKAIALRDQAWADIREYESYLKELDKKPIDSWNRLDKLLLQKLLNVVLGDLILRRLGDIE